MIIKLTNKFHKTKTSIVVKDDKISGISAIKAFKKLCPNFRKCSCKTDCGEYDLRKDSGYSYSTYTIHKKWKEFDIEKKKFTRFTRINRESDSIVFAFCLDENRDIFKIEWESKDMGPYDKFINPKIIKKYEKVSDPKETFEYEFGA